VGTFAAHKVREGIRIHQKVNRGFCGDGCIGTGEHTLPETRKEEAEKNINGSATLKKTRGTVRGDVDLINLWRWRESQTGHVTWVVHPLRGSVGGRIKGISKV